MNDSLRMRKRTCVGCKVAHEQGAGVIVVAHDHRGLHVFGAIYEMEDGLMNEQPNPGPQTIN